MNRIQTVTVKLLTLVSAMGLSAALAAPSVTTVYQRQTSSDSIELSNLAQEGSVPMPTSIDTAAVPAPLTSETKSAEAASTAPLKAKKKVLKKIIKDDGTEEEVWVASDEETDSTNATDQVATDTTPGAISGATNGSYGASTWSSMGNASGGAIAGGSVNTGSSSGPNGGTGSAGSTGGVPSTGIPANPTLPTPTTPLQAKLDNYRTMMLNEVLSANVANPALTRRYQMMNRTTYQSILGY